MRRISKVTGKSKTTIHYWILEFKEVLNPGFEKKERKLIAMDETKIRVNKTWYYVYAAVDVDTRELIYMKAYTSRNYLTTLNFIKHVLKFCSSRDVEIITDKMPSYR